MRRLKALLENDLQHRLIRALDIDFLTGTTRWRLKVSVFVMVKTPSINKGFLI